MKYSEFITQKTLKKSNTFAAQKNRNNKTI